MTICHAGSEIQAIPTSIIIQHSAILAQIPSAKSSKCNSKCHGHIRARIPVILAALHADLGRINMLPYVIPVRAEAKSDIVAHIDPNPGFTGTVLRCGADPLRFE